MSDSLAHMAKTLPKIQAVWGITGVNGEGFIGNLWPYDEKVPERFEGFTITHAFKTKRQALAHIRKHYGYIAHRPDLRKLPHCWRVPKPVKVWIVAEVGAHG